MTNRLYLDHAATTPIHPAAIAAMAEGMARWANPSSPHAEGRAARRALEEARERIRAALGWLGELVFTSGASEAIAIGLGRSTRHDWAVSAVEHDAVRRTMPEVPDLRCDADGIVDLGGLPAGASAAIQHVNSETGVIQPLDRLGAAVRAGGGLLFADCAQSAGKLPLPDADLIAVSAHKLGGPPGIGALLVRDLGLLRAVGGQEQGYRAGTENLPAALGFAAALEAQAAWMDRAEALRRQMEAALAGAILAGTGAPRLPTIGSYRLPGMAATAQLVRLDMSGIAVSAGSACSSGSLKPSRVLIAMGWSDTAARETIRVSFGPTTTSADIDRFIAAWRALAGSVRQAA